MQMMMLVYVLTAYNVFHVPLVELGRFIGPGAAVACERAKVTTPVTGLGNWSKCERRWVPAPAPPVQPPK